MAYKICAVCDNQGIVLIVFSPQALAEQKHELDKKTIDPKMALAVTKPKKLFVGGISQEVTVDDIKEHFSKFGKVSLNV